MLPYYCNFWAGAHLNVREDEKVFFKDIKGQSALEYLMTYGWALIVIVVVIAALYLLVPKQAATCTGFENLPINNWNLTTTGLSLEVANGTGRSLTNVVFSGKFTQGATVTNVANAATTIAVGGISKPTLAATLTAGQNVRADVNVTYNDGSFNKTGTGTCNGTP